MISRRRIFGAFYLGEWHCQHIRLKIHNFTPGTKVERRDRTDGDNANDYGSHRSIANRW